MEVLGCGYFVWLVDVIVEVVEKWRFFVVVEDALECGYVDKVL
jgi:hypothetical protein